MLVVGIGIESVLGRCVHSLFTEPERVVKDFLQQERIAAANLKSSQIVPQLADLLASANAWRAENGGSELDALEAVGYEERLDQLARAHNDLARLSRLPASIRHASLALGAVLLALGLALAPLLVETTFQGSQIPRWCEVVAAVAVIVAFTLSAVAASWYYYSRRAYAGLLQTYG